MNFLAQLMIGVFLLTPNFSEKAHPINSSNLLSSSQVKDKKENPAFPELPSSASEKLQEIWDILSEASEEINSRGTFSGCSPIARIEITESESGEVSYSMSVEATPCISNTENGTAVTESSILDQVEEIRGLIEPNETTLVLLGIGAFFGKVNWGLAL